MMLLLLCALQGDTVTFKLDQNIVFVEATINGEGPFNFIFDTGASVTVIKPSTARKLKLKVEPVEGAGEGLLGALMKSTGLVPEVTRVESIALGKAEVKDFEAVVMNVPQADIPLTMAGKTYHGIIGYHFISRFITTIDYKARTIKLEPNDFDPGPTFPQLERGGQPHLGFTYKTIGDDLANEVGVEGGVVVGALQEGGPAEKAGLKRGDIITAIDGRRITTADDFRAIAAKAKPGQMMEFKLLRDKEQQTIKVRVGRRGAATSPNRSSTPLDEYRNVLGAFDKSLESFKESTADHITVNPLRCSALLQEASTALRRMAQLVAEPYTSQLMTLGDELKEIRNRVQKATLTQEDVERADEIRRNVLRDLASDRVVYRHTVLPEKP